MADHHLYQGVVSGKLTDAVTVQAIRAAVAHIDDCGKFTLDQQRHHGGAHAGELLKLLRLVINRKVRQFYRISQHLIQFSGSISGVQVRLTS